MLKALPKIDRFEQSHWFVVFGIIIVLSSWTAMIMEFPALMLAPAGLLFGFLCISDPKKIFYLFFLLLPFSVEIELPGGFGTDLPTEPIMIALFAVFGMLILLKPNQISKSFLTHPISLIMICHLFWIFFTSFFAVNQLYAFKYLLAKSWYIFPFYFLPFYLFKNTKDFRSLFKLLLGSLLVSVFYVMLRHGMQGFSFMGINEAVKPIFRNHVNYAAILVGSLPFVWYLHRTSTSRAKGILYGTMLLIFIVAIYLTFTRAAYVVAFALLGAYFMISWKLTKIAAFAFMISVFGFTHYLIQESRYLALAPNYEKTIAHTKFNNLVEATYKMQDVSTMERLHRWVAGFQMVQKRPFTGYGPSNFYINYKDHAVSSFKTYVSDNPEKSGIHNNYLMVFVEQGFIGFIIMLFVAFLPIIYAEKTYHLLANKHDKYLIMAAALAYLGIDVIILINDLLEADKIGPIFFLSAAIISIIAVSEKKPKTNL